MYENLSVGRIFFGDGKQIIAGTKVTRATVLSETQDGMNNPGVGSLYLSTDRAYLRVAAANAAADWEKITTSAAD